MSLNDVIFPKLFLLGSRDSKAVQAFQKAIFTAATSAHRALSPYLLPAGTTVFRNVPTKLSDPPREMTHALAREVPDGSSLSNCNRWSGQLAGTNLACGALYTCFDPIALTNEALRYSRQKAVKTIAWQGSPSGTAKYTVFGSPAGTFQQLLANRVYFVFRLRRPIRIVNLDPEVSPGFYDLIQQDDCYRKAKDMIRTQASLQKLIFEPLDYTASRPLGLNVLLNKSVDGFRIRTVPDEVSDGKTKGHNLIIGGADGHPVDFLEYTGRLVEGLDGGRPALLQIDHKPGSIDRAILSGSVFRTDG